MTRAEEELLGAQHAFEAEDFLYFTQVPCARCYRGIPGSAFEFWAFLEFEDGSWLKFRGFDCDPCVVEADVAATIDWTTFDLFVLL